MHSPEYYTRHLSIICEDIRCDLVNLLNNKFDGHYVRRDGDKYIKQANIMGTPIIFELKAGDNGKILYKSAMWSGNFLISAQTDYYELFDDSVLEVYKALYSIAFSEENS